jgi:hypothetical protein
LLLVALLGARGLDADAIWYDEWWSVYYAGGGLYGPASPAQVVQRVYENQFVHENNPPGYYLALAGWSGLVGWTEFGARALSLLAGLLAVALTYRLGCDLATPVVGLIAATVLGTSAFFIYYLHEMRPYAFSLPFILAVVWAYWRVATRKGGRWPAVALAVSAAGLLYIHYFAALAVGAVVLYHLLFVPKTRAWWGPTLLLVVAGLVFLPWLGATIEAVARLDSADEPFRQASALSPGQMVERLLFMFSNGNMALLLIALAYTVRGAARPIRLVWWWLLVVVAAVIAINLRFEMLGELRYLIAAWPALALLVGFGISELSKRGVRPVLVLVIWAGVGVWSVVNATPLMVAFNDPTSNLYSNSVAPQAYVTLPWRTLRDTLKARVQPGDALAFHRPDYAWAIEGIFEFYLHDVPVRSTIMEVLPGRDQNNEYFSSARQYIADARRVWVAVDKTMRPTFRLAEFERALADDYIPCGAVLDLSQLRLDLYARVPEDAPPFEFGEGIGLRLMELLPTHASDSLNVVLGWDVSSEVPPSTYSVALHVEDEQGQLMAQTDYGLPNSGFTCQPSVLPLSDLPSGTYSLRVVVYNWSTGERLTVGGNENDRLWVGSFSVG